MPIVSQKNNAAQLLYLKIFFKEKARNMLGQYERHSRETGFIKINEYKSSYEAIYRSLMYNTPNGYLKFLDRDTFFFTTSIGGLGRVMVNTKFLHNIEINEPRKFMIFKFEIKPMYTRGKLYYLAATHMDILLCVNQSILEIYNNERALIHVLTQYIAMFSL